MTTQDCFSTDTPLFLSAPEITHAQLTQLWSKISPEGDDKLIVAAPTVEEAASTARFLWLQPWLCVFTVNHRVNLDNLVDGGHDMPEDLLNPQITQALDRCRIVLLAYLTGGVTLEAGISAQDVQSWIAGIDRRIAALAAYGNYPLYEVRNMNAYPNERWLQFTWELPMVGFTFSTDSFVWEQS